jgi:hypothetical protein
MRTLNNKPLDALLPAIIVAAGVMTAALVLNEMVRLVDATPSVGDIVTFSASAVAPNDDDSRLLVYRDDQFGCVMDMNVMRRGGGSLVIESRPATTASGFRVHWAGARTSSDPGNCGSDAELIVDRLDLNILSVSAGGYGVDPKAAVPLFSNGVGEMAN